MPTVHPRTLVRKAAATALESASVVPAGRVFRTRVLPYRSQELPALAVYTLNDDNDEDFAASPRTYKRRVQLAVEIALQEGADPDVTDDELDAACWLVEGALNADPTLDGAADDLQYQSTETEFVEIQGRAVALARLVFAVTYYNAAREYDTPDNFNTATAKYETRNGAKAEDNFPLPEP